MQTASGLQFVNSLWGSWNESLSGRWCYSISSDRKWGAVSVNGLGTLFWEHLRCFLRKIPKQSIRLRHEGLVFWFWLGSVRCWYRDHDFAEWRRGFDLLEIADPIREDAAETLEYLRSEDVTLKIILVTIQWRFLILLIKLVLPTIKVILTVLRSAMRSWRLWLRILRFLVVYLRTRKSC